MYNGDSRINSSIQKIMPPITPYPNQPNTSNLNLNQTPSFWKQKWVRIVLIFTLLIIVLIVIIIVIQQNKTPQAISKQFLGDVLAGKTAQSYQLTSANFRTSTSLSTWTNDAQSIASECTGKITPIYTSQKSQTAEDEFTSKESTGGICHININLIHGSNKWQVNSVVSNF
jgi:hypothetical protein